LQYERAGLADRRTPGGPVKEVREMSANRMPRDENANKTGVGAAILAFLILGMLAVSLFFAAGCGYDEEVGDGGPVDSERTSTTVSPGEEETDNNTADQTVTTIQSDQKDQQTSTDTRTVTLYFSKDTLLTAASREIPATEAIGAATMKALLEGPTASEKEYGLYTSIPANTAYLALDISKGIATVDLSQEYASGGGSLAMMMRLAQVVYTLTQFDTVSGVRFQLDGKPVEVFGGEGIVLDHPIDRSDYEGLVTPAILVESPAISDTVQSPLRITGTANTFEAVFQVNIVNWDGLIIAEQMVMASSGSGTRGTFDVTIPFDVEQSGRGALIVFEESAKDGTPVNVVEIPLNFKK